MKSIPSSTDRTPAPVIKRLRKHRKPLGWLMVGLMAVWLPGPLAQSATLTWNADGVAGPPIGGSGTWDTTSALWANGAVMQPWSNTTNALDVALFGGVAGTVSLDAPISAGRLAFDALTSGTYSILGNANLLTLSGGGYSATSTGPIGILANESASITSAIQLGASQNWNVAGYERVVVDGTISQGAGSFGISKDGKGSLVVNSLANTFSGATSVVNGILVIRAPGSLGTGTSTINVAGNGTVGGGTLMLAGGSLAGSDYTRNFSIAGSGMGYSPSTQAAPQGFILPMGAITSVGNNTISGSITTSSTTATRVLSTMGNLTISGNLTLGAGQDFIAIGNPVNGPGNIFVTSQIPLSTGGIIKTGGGVLVLSNNSNLFSGRVRIDAGFVRVSSAGALGTSTAADSVRFNGGTLEIRTDTPDFSNKNVSLADNNGTIFVDRGIGGSGLNQTVLFKDFVFGNITRTLTLNGRDGYNFSIGAVGANLGGNGGGNIAITTGSINGLSTINGNITVGDGTANRLFTFTTAGDALWNGGLLVASGAALPTLVKAGAGTLTMTGLSSTYTGNTNITAGTLAVDQIGGANGGGALNGVPGGAVNLGATTVIGAFDYLGAADTGVGEITGKLFNLSGTTAGGILLANQAGTSPSALVLTSNISANGAGIKTLFLGGSSGLANTIEGVIQDNTATNITSVTKVGSGTWVLAPAVANYNAGSTVNVTIASTTNSNVLTVGSTTGLVVGQTVSGTNVPAGSVITAILGPNTFSINNNISTAVAAATSLTFGAVTNFTGNVVVGGGTLKAQATAGSGNGSNVISDTSTLTFNTDPLRANGYAGGTFEYQGFSTGSTELIGAVTPGAGAGTLKATAGASGVTTLRAASLGTRVAGATLDFATSGGATIEFVTNPTLTDGIIHGYATYNGVDWATTTGTGPFTVTAYTGYTTGLPATGGSATANYLTNAPTTVTTGAVAAGSLKLAGAQTITLGGALTLTGASATSPAGILFDNSGGPAVITGSNILPSVAATEIVITTNGSTTAANILANTLTINSTLGLGLATPITKAGTGILVLTANNTYTGNTTINQGTIRLSGATATLGAIQAGGITTIRQEGILDLFGAGVPTVLYTATPTALTAVPRITVGALNGAGVITNSSGTQSSLSIGPSNGSAAGVFSGIIEDGTGGVVVVKQGSSTQILSGLNTYTGPTVIAAGTLIANSLADGGNASSIGASSSAAANLVFAGGTLQYTGATTALYQTTQTPSVSINRLFTLAGNGTIDSSGTFGSNTVTVAGGQNNAALVFSNPGAVVFGSTGAKTLTLTGTSTADNTMGLRLVNNDDGTTLSVTKAGGGLWILGNAANSYTGATNFNAGQMIGYEGTTLPSVSPISFNGGVFQTSGTFVRPLATSAVAGANTVTFVGSGGFAAYESKLTVNIGGAGAQMNWTGGNGFVPTGNTLILSSGTALSETEFINPIFLGTANTATRTINVEDNGTTTTDYGTISSVISGSANPGVAAITKNGGGFLFLTGNNTFSGGGNATAGTGGLLINNGTVLVNSMGANGSLGALTGPADAANRLVLGSVGSANNTTLIYFGPGEDVIRRIELGGSGNTGTIQNDGSGPLRLTDITFTQTAARNLQFRGINTDMNEVTATISDASPTAITNVIKSDSGVWIISGNNTYTGTTTHNTGLLGIGSDTALGTGAVNLVNASVQAFYGPRTLSNTFTITNANTEFIGTNNLTFSGIFANSGGNSGMNNFMTGGAVFTASGTINLQDGTSARTFVMRGTGTTVLSGVIQNGGTAVGTLQLEMAQNASLNSGPGMVVISGVANTYTGNTNSSSGILQLNAPAGTYSGAATPLGAGTNSLSFIGNSYFQAQNNLVLSQILTLSGNGVNAVVQGPGSLTFNGNFVNTGGNNTLWNNSAGLLTFAGQFLMSESGQARTVTLGGTGNITINNAMVNNGNASALIKTGSGTLTTLGVNTFTGALNVLGGTINTTFNTAANNQLGAGVLTMGAGIVNATKTDSTTSTQTYSSTTLNANTSGRYNLFTSGGGTLNLTTGVITRGAQSTIDFTKGTGNINVGTTTMGNWATITTGGVTNFATKDGSNNVIAVTTASKDAVTSWAAADNVTDSAGFSGSYALTTGINSLRFNAAVDSTVTVTANSTLNVAQFLGTTTVPAAGGILVTPNVGARTSTITGGRLTSSGLELILNNQNATVGSSLVINSSIINSSGNVTALTKAGPGLVVLSGNNYYTGTTSINNGTLRLAGGNAIMDNASVVLANNPTAILDLNNGTETIGSLSGGGLLGATVTGGVVTGAITVGGTVAIGTGSLTINQTGNTTYSGQFTGSGSLTVTGSSVANILTLNTASNPFTGTLNVTGGQLSLAHVSIVAATVPTSNMGLVSAVNISNLGGLNIDSSGATVPANRLNDAAPISLLNTPTNALSATTGLGFTTDQVSTIAARSETVGAVTLAGGANTLRVNATAINVVGQLLMPTLTRNNRSTLFVLGTNLDDAINAQRGDITVSNAGNIVADLRGGGSTASGTTNISILPWAVGSAVTTAGAGNTFVTYSTVGGFGNGFRALNLTTEYEQLVSGGALTLANNVRYSGASTLTLTGSGHSVNALLFDNTSTTAAISLLGSGAGDSLTVGSGAFLFLGSATPTGITVGGFGNGIALGAGSTEYVFHQMNTSADGVTIASALTSAGSLTKDGPGTLTLTGNASAVNGILTVNDGLFNANNAVGTTTVNIYRGTFASNVANVLPDSAVVNVSAAGATYAVNADDTISGLTSVADGNVVISAPATLTLKDNGSPTTLGARLTGSGSFNKDGTGTLTYTAGQGIEGGVGVTGGTLRLDNTNPALQKIADFAAVNVGVGATFDFNGVSEKIGSLGGGGNVTLGAATLNTGGNNQSTVFSGVLSGGIAGVNTLTKIGAGTMTLSGANTFVGNVLVSGTGGLTVSGGTAISDSANVRLNGWGSTLTVNSSETVNALTGTRNTNLVLAPGATLTGTYVNGTVLTTGSGTADTDNSFRVVKLDTSTAGLTPGMLISGPTGLTTAGSYIVQVIDGRHILINQLPGASVTDIASVSITPVSVLSSNMSGAGGFTKNGAGQLILTGANTYSGLTTLNAGDIQIGGIWDGAKYSLQDALSDNSQIVFSTTNAVNLNFANNATNISSFERVGSIAGGGGTNAKINLLAGANTAVLALGGDNSTSTFAGQFLGNNSATWLVKEGSGTFTWDNSVTDVFDGTIRVDQGGFVVQGSQGMDGANRILMANRTGSSLTVATTGGDSISFLAGGGRGASRTFPNGVVGALLGNYIGQTGGGIVLNTSLTVTEDTATNTFVYGGDISGVGGLTKNGRATLELRGNNTYTGDTVINGSGTDTTTSILRIGAYGGASGLGAVGAGGFGSLSSSTRVSLVTGTGGTNRNVLFDLNGANVTIATLISSGTFGTKTVTTGAGSLTLANAGTSTFDGTIVAGQGTQTGTGIMNIGQVTVGAGNWTVSGTNGINGPVVTVNSGATLTLNNSANNALGDANRVVVNGTLAFGGSQTASETIGSLSGSGTVALGSNHVLTITESAAATFSGVITGTGTSGITLSQLGSLTLSGTNTYTGVTTVNGRAVLNLDLGTTGTVLNNASTLSLGGGTVRFRGTATEVVGGLALTQGSNWVGSEFAAGTAFLNVGAITRPTPSIAGTGRGALFVRSGSVITSTANVSGILGGYAVTGANYIYASDWAVANGASAITGLAAGGYSNNLMGVNVHTNVTGSFAVPASFGMTQTETIRFNNPGAFTITLNESLAVDSGGILVTAGVGANDVTIRNGTDFIGLSGGSGDSGRVTDELIIHQYNPRGSLILDTVIQDYTGFTSLTKTGPGRLILTQDNTYQGSTSIYGGVLQVGIGGSTGTLNTTSLGVANYGYLSLNRGDQLGLELANVISGTGTIRVEGTSTSSVILRGASSYSGTTSVIRGSLVAGNATALGSTAGLTVVYSGAGLIIQGSTIAENITLRGATLTNNGTGNSTLTGMLSATANSVIANEDINIFTLSGPIVAASNVGITFQGMGTIILGNAANAYGQSTIGNGMTVQVGNNTAGSFGQGAILNNGAIVTNTNNGHLVLGNAMSGSGSFTQTRNTVYLTGNNTYTGGTTVGLQSVNAGVELRVGNDTYTGSLGSGALNINSVTGGNATVRYHLNGDYVLNNTININPSTDGGTARNATLLRQGLGNMTIAGNLTIGDTTGAVRLNASPPLTATSTQRAVIQTEGGGKLTFSGSLSFVDYLGGTLSTGASNVLNLINNGVFAFGGSGSHTYDGTLTGNGVWMFDNSGTTTLNGVNTFNGANYLRQGIVAVNNAAGTGINDDADMYLLRSSILQFNVTETIGGLYGQRGSAVNIASGATLTVDDAIPQLFAGSLTGAGNLVLTGTNIMAMYGTNTLTGNVTINNATVISTSLTNAFGTVGTLTLGGAAGAGNLEYVGSGETFSHAITLAGTGSNRITANGNGALNISGNITASVTSTLQLTGQTGGYFNPIKNQVTGAITEGTAILSLSMPATANDDRFGVTGRWALTNKNNDFSGGITVAVGILEIGGILNDGGAGLGGLGTGNGATSSMGDLTATRTIDLGTANFDGRRYDIAGNGDQIGAAAAGTITNTLTPTGSTGTILFNDPNTGTATLGSNITFTQSFNNGTNPGAGQIINDGVKVIVINGALTSGATGARNWILDGSNTGTNTIAGVISNGSGAVVSILKEGAGTWRLAGANTFTGGVTINRGILEVTGGNTINDAAVVAITNAGGDGSSVGLSTFRVLTSETIGGLTGGIGANTNIATGAVLTMLNASQTYNGIITGTGGITRSNNDANARVSTLAGRSTYTGVTSIIGGTSGTNIQGNRIDVYSLANGGLASGIGASTSAASNLVIDTFTGLGGLRYIGFATANTDRLFTIGANASSTATLGSASIWADGQALGLNVPSLNFTNTGDIAFTAANLAATLTLRGSNGIADNLFAPRIVNNGSSAVNLQKLENSTWVLSNANTYSGTTTIGGGLLAITNPLALGTTAGGTTLSGAGGPGLQLRNNITVTGETLTVTGDGAGFSSGANSSNTWAGNVVLNQNVRLSARAGGTLNISGVMSSDNNARVVNVYGPGTLVFSGANTYLGATNLLGGTLQLNYTTATGSKLADATALTFGGTGLATLFGTADYNPTQAHQYYAQGGTMELIGGAHVEVVSATTINTGASRLIRTGGTSTLRMNAITRNVGGVLDFGAAGLADTDSNNLFGILAGTGAANLGGWATINKTDWATSVNGGAADAVITALPASGYSTDSYLFGNNTNVVAFNNVGASFTTNSIRFNQASGGTITLSGSNFLQSGGILVTPNSGAVTIGGGASTTLRLNTVASGANSQDFIIHQHSASDLTIALQLAENLVAGSANTQGLTKTGTGKVILTENSTLRGNINILQGTLQVGNGGATGSFGVGNATGATVFNAVIIDDNASLVFNTTNSAEFGFGALNGSGNMTLAGTNTQPILLDDDNANFVGTIVVNGGELRVRGNNNALGALRALVTVNAGGTLAAAGATQTFVNPVTFNQGSILKAQFGNGVNTSATFSGAFTLNNTAPGGMTINVEANQALTLTGIMYANSGFTKSGNGILTMSANQMQDVLDGQTGLTANPALLGQIVVAQGELRVGNQRALGATGVGNETVVQSGATLDLRGQALNYSDDPDTAREIVIINGTGLNGTGALRSTGGTGQLSFLTLGSDAAIGPGGFANAGRLDIATFDTNPNTGSSLAGNFTRNQPVIAGNNRTLTIIGSRGNDATVFHEPNFSSPLNQLIIREGIFRFEQDLAPNTTWTGVTAANITNGLVIGYGGPTLADQTNAALGNGPVVGARLNLYRNNNIHHTFNIIMDGVTAAANNGANYIDTGTDTIVAPRTFLDGTISLTGAANRNFIHVDSGGTYSVVEQGNLTASLLSKLIVGGKITGPGGFSKTGFRELRLTANNDFTGDFNVLRFGTSAMPWESNTVQINGVDYPTLGLAEGWAEWGVTLNGPNGAISGTSNILLQRRGMITLDNTGRLDATSGVVGTNNNNRINDAANFNMSNGWLRINGGTVNNTESIATAGGAKLNLLTGTNIIDLYPTDGAGTNMTLTIGEITRASGSVLRIQNLDSTSTFSTASVGDSVRVRLNTIGTLSEVGAATVATNKKVVVGILGGTMPLPLTEDFRVLGYGNLNVSDLWNQQRNLQFLTGSHFMTYDGGYLRPLDDSEYYTPADGLLNTANGGGQNVNLTDIASIVNQDTTINALRFGPTADNNGSGGAIQSGTTLTSFTDHVGLNLYVDGTLSISSGMISSAYFTMGNTQGASVVIAGGNLNFGTREAIINNQNGFFNMTAGVISTGNLEIRSNILGSGGLLKTGLAQVVLDGQNSYSGLTTISDGTLFLRNGRTALGVGGAGNGVYISGNGNLNTGNGIQVGTATAREDIVVGPLTGSNQVMRVDNDLTNWFSNLTIDNVDAGGLSVNTPIIRTDNGAASIINGNIFGGNIPITQDVVATDPRRLSFNSAGNNVFIVRGQIGDKSDANGNAIPIADTISTLASLAGTRTNENEVLRVDLGGASIETNYLLEKQYNAVGRLTLESGVMLVNYDPAAAGNDGTGFWTNAAISKIPNADSTTTSFAINGSTVFQGFQLGSTSATGVNNGNTALFLTRAGQYFNMASWSTVGTGSKWIGGTNESGTVTYGDGTGSLTLAGATSRLYAASGGTVVFNQRMTGNVGTAPNSIGFIKVGRGTVELQNTGLNTASDSSFELAGGTLVLNHDGQNVARVGTLNAIFSGGTLRSQANSLANSTENFVTDNNTDRVVQFRLGSSEIISEARNGRNMLINIGNANANNTTANLTRALGSTANFVEMTTGSGTPQITLNFNASTTAILRNRAIGWATYGTQPRQALDFAMTDSVNGNDIRAFNRSTSDYNNNVAGWLPSQDISENGGAGFTGTLASSMTLSSIRFDSSADSIVTLGAGQTLTVSTDGIVGGILVSSNVGSFNKTITGGAGLTTNIASGDLVIHQYSTGNLNIQTPITGAINLVISGPSTVDANTIGTTGTVVLSGANTYTGRTIINGAILSVSDVAQLSANPAAGSTSSAINATITLNGGTLRYTGTGTADLGNRGVRMEGVGGTIDVVDAAAELRISDTLESQELYRGDLIKVGAGTLTLEGQPVSATATNQPENPNFRGLIDIREGTLRLNGEGVLTATAGTSTLLGTNSSYAEGTIFRNGTNFAVQFGNSNNATPGDYTLEEWFTFEGNNYVTIGSLNPAVTTPTGFVNPTVRPVNFHGVNDIRGTVTFDVVSGGVMRFNNGTGYLTGSGDIIKDGLGQMEFRGNAPDWTGNLVIKQGTVYAISQADMMGTGYLTGKTITLGDASRQGTAQLLIQNPDGVQGWTFEVNHNINVVYNPTQTKRIGFDNVANGNKIAFNGDITLNDNLIVLLQDGGISNGGEQAMLNFNGAFKDGILTGGNVLFQATDNGGANDNTSGRMVGYAVLNGNNSQWTGDVTVSSLTTYDQDKTTVLRFGNNLALTAANEVTMNYNSIIQAGGVSTTIGSLTTQGGVGAFNGDANTMSASVNGSTEIIENASATVGTITISQSTPVSYEAVWDAKFRDGTLNSQFFAPGANILQPSASLNLGKSGSGWATLALDNDYTGTTTVSAGILQVGRGGIGDTGAIRAATAPGTTVLAGATLAGTGVVHGATSIAGILAPGDVGGAAMGTLTIAGNLTLSSTATTQLQVQRATYNNPGALTLSDAAFNTWLSGVTTDAYSNHLSEPVSTSYHDQVNVDGSMTWTAGTKITLVNNGYTPTAGDVFKLFDWFNVSGTVNAGSSVRTGNEVGTDLNLFPLGGEFLWNTSLFASQGILIVVVPEPSRVLLLMFGLMMFMFRRRRIR